MTDKKIPNTRNYGVRLDHAEQYIMARLIDKLGQKAPTIFRDATIFYARSLGIKTDRAAILEIVRGENKINDK